jgi:hypothetical protein
LPAAAAQVLLHVPRDEHNNCLALSKVEKKVARVKVSLLEESPETPHQLHSDIREALLLHRVMLRKVLRHAIREAARRVQAGAVWLVIYALPPLILSAVSPLGQGSFRMMIAQKAAMARVTVTESTSCVRRVTLS